MVFQGILLSTRYHNSPVQFLIHNLKVEGHFSPNQLLVVNPATLQYARKTNIKKKQLWSKVRDNIDSYALITIHKLMGC